MADKIADMQQNITTDLRLDSDLRPDFEKVHNLLPAVVVDTNTKEVLMVAYMNEESYERTLVTGETWFWSRSRQELWHKGEPAVTRKRLYGLPWIVTRTPYYWKLSPTARLVIPVQGAVFLTKSN